MVWQGGASHSAALFRRYANMGLETLRKRRPCDGDATLPTEAVNSESATLHGSVDGPRLHDGTTGSAA